MGTRADFYVGRGAQAEWIGSVAWDGYPDGLPVPLKMARTEAAFRREVAAYFKDRDDVTLPAQGWPWPWDDSGTTDYAYAFDAGWTWGTSGRRWWNTWEEPENERECGGDLVVFPDMKARKAVAMDRRSGLIILKRGG